MRNVGGEGGRKGGGVGETERIFLAAITGHRDHYCTITTIIIIVIANYPIIVTIIIIVIEILLASVIIVLARCDSVTTDAAGVD